VLSINGYGVAMAKSGGGFFGHRHTMTVAMRVSHGSRFLHHGMLTVNGESEKGGKNEACCGSARYRKRLFLAN